MENTPVILPALYIIFTLLNAVRRGIPRQNIWREFRRQKVALKPRLSFWLAVCKQAGLIDDYTRSSPADENRLRVKSYASQWLDKPSNEQTIHLIEAWQNAPQNSKPVNSARNCFGNLNSTNLSPKKTALSSTACKPWDCWTAKN